VPPAASTADVTVNFYQTPTTASAGSAQTQCETSTATLAGNTPTVGTGTWTLVSGSGSITTPSSPTSGVTGLGYGVNTFQWTISNGTCTPSSATVAITRYQNPTTASAGSAQNLCGTGSATTAALGGNTPSVGSGAWSQVSGPGTATFSASTSGSSTATVNAYGTYDLRWTISNGTCTPSTADVTVNFNPIPDQTITPAASSVCANSTGNTASVTAASGGTYNWTISGGTITSGQTAQTVTYTAGTGSAVTLNCVVTSSALCASAGGQATSVTINPVPGAPSSDVSYNVALPFSLKIKISDLLTNWTGTSLSVQSVANSADGGTVTKNSTYIFYSPPTNSSPTSPDTIPYTVSGANGCSTAASIDVVFVGQPGGVAQQITVVGGVATVNFAGIPGYPYIVQRAEDVSFTVNLTTVLTTNAPADGLFTFEDSTSLSQAYYRLKYNP
jgi:hypothetical protein